LVDELHFVIGAGVVGEGVRAFHGLEAQEAELNLQVARARVTRARAITAWPPRL